MAQVRLEIKVEKHKNRETKQEFNSFKTYRKDGKAMDLRFTKEVKEVPLNDCFILVDSQDMNIDENRKFPVLWVKKISGTEAKFQPNAEKNAEKVGEYFEVPTEEQE